MITAARACQKTNKFVSTMQRHTYALKIMKPKKVHAPPQAKVEIISKFQPRPGNRRPGISSRRQLKSQPQLPGAEGPPEAHQ
jgi:hypothetical protein